MLTPGQAYDVTRILEGVITQGTGAGYTYMGCGSEAGKTGTSEGLSDAWFVGYTPKFSTAVWVGHPQSRESAQEGDCPEEPEEGEEEAEGKEKGGKEGGNEPAAEPEPAPEPTPAPAPAPPPPPGGGLSPG